MGKQRVGCKSNRLIMKSKFKYYSDCRLFDLEMDAQQTVVLWKDLNEEIRVQSILSDNQMHRAFCNASEILDEIQARLATEGS